VTEASDTRRVPKDSAPASRGPSGPQRGIRVRDATVADLHHLSELAYASKAHWGYDDTFMRACRDELTVRSEDLEAIAVRVGEANRRIVGFHGVAPFGDGVVELTWLFVAPEAMGRGFGRVLLADAVTVARLADARRLRIEADPNAEDFYARAGAARIGAVPSQSIAGRVLPLLELAVG
jgi:GNAT superfamily N-acetyltransferase